MLLSFPEVPFSCSPPRNYMVFAIFLDLQRPRLQVPQTAYKERTSELIFRIHSFTHTVNPQQTVKASWDCICKHPMATPGQGILWCRTSLLKLCCWRGAGSLPAAFILEYPSAEEAWYLLSLLHHACLWAACPPFYPAEVFWGRLQWSFPMEGLFREEQQSAQSWGEG